MKSAERARDVWSNGSYPVMARNYLSMGATLVDSTGVGPDDEVLDIGCGTGTVAISAARRGARVTGLDVTPAMLEAAWNNAETAGLAEIDLQQGDATDLPFDEDAFDVVLSSLGHMYGDPPDEAARELLRVTRPGGRIGFTSWTPTSLFPEMAGVAMTYLDPADLPEFTEPPFMWGDPEVVRDRLGEGVDEFAFAEEVTAYPALSPAHFWDEMADNSGLLKQMLDDVADEERSSLRERMNDTIEPYFDEGENSVKLAYLRTVGITA